ncbi:MFS transporter [Yoonia sp. R2331]|uniref:MFS transporter n=1 Tax=Yoonia sp. R2331 TaxID=3237238 RepID=UPI0034E45666
MRYGPDFSIALAIIAAIALAQTVLGFTLPLLAFEMSASGTGLALIKGAGFIPNILFAIFIGVINDRTTKARAFRSYTMGLALVTALLCLAALTDFVSLPGLMLFMVIFNGLSYATSNAQMTLIRLTVPHAHLSDATGLSSTVFSVISTVGPAVAGLALVALGHIGVITACMVLMLATAALARRLNPPEDLPPPQPFWPALAEGWHVLRANRELLMMTVVIVLTNAAAGAFDTALILKLKTAVASNDFQIGVVLAFGGLGAITGSRFAAPLRRAMGYRAAFFWPIWALAALYLTIIADLPIWAYCLISFLDGWLALFFAIGVWSYRQESTAAAHMGRVAGLTGAIFKIGMPPVIILSGWLTDAGALPAVLMMAAGIMAASGLFLAWVAGWGWPRLTPAQG